jgi:[ribosomal protein S5]-alanine N-acetyltransferase
MARKSKYDRKTAAENLGKVMKAFGETVSEIFEDPDVKKKAREFSQSLVDAAAKVVESRVKDDEVKAKFQNVGKAAQNLGQTLTDHFKTED